MCNIAELTMFLRGRVELPVHFHLDTEAFREGWSSLRSGDSRWLDKAMRRCGPLSPPSWF